MMRRDILHYFQPRFLLIFLVAIIVLFLAFPFFQREEDKAEEVHEITHRVFLDVDIGDQRIGRLVIGLYGQVVPKTVDIKNWIRNIEQHASDNVNKIFVGNKADMDESKRAVPTAKGQALADEYGIKFFETSAKTNLNVEQVFFSIATDIKQRLAETDTRTEPQTIRISKPDDSAGPSQPPPKSACCGS